MSLPNIETNVVSIGGLEKRMWAEQVLSTEWHKEGEAEYMYITYGDGSVEAWLCIGQQRFQRIEYSYA